MSKNRSNKAWLHRHLTDSFVKQAQNQNYRSRAAFKLLEIDEAERLIRPGQVVVDLGSAPGSWSQVVRERLAGAEGGRINGRILALDLLPMASIADVEFLQGDFREDSVLQKFESMLAGERVDLVLSDMAPNLSGIGVTDDARISHVCELALEFAVQWLKPSGSLLVKTFVGASYQDLVLKFRASFKQVLVRKPKASRSESAETYLLGRQLKG